MGIGDWGFVIGGCVDGKKKNKQKQKNKRTNKK